jgi:hypothetical protein
MTTPARTPCPVIPPSRDVEHEPTRQLLAALYEEGWMAYPAQDDHLQVVSPDHVRSLTLHLVDVDSPRLMVSVDDDRLPLAWATQYVRAPR